MDNPFEEIARRQDRIESLLNQILATLQSVGLSIAPKTELPISIERVAQLLKISVGAVYQDKSIPVYKCKNRLQFFESDILAYIKSGQQAKEIPLNAERRVSRRRRIREPN